MRRIASGTAARLAARRRQRAARRCVDAVPTPFDIPRILEFYARPKQFLAFITSKAGAGRHRPRSAFLAQSLADRARRYDEATRAPARGTDGFCTYARRRRNGEAVARIEARGKLQRQFRRLCQPGRLRQEGPRDVFEPARPWMRSGDLMRKDARGLFYFSVVLVMSVEGRETCRVSRSAQVLAAARACATQCLLGSKCGFSMDALAWRRWRWAMISISTGLVKARRGSPVLRPASFFALCETLETTETFKHKKQALGAQNSEAEGIGGAIFRAAGA